MCVSLEQTWSIYEVDNGERNIHVWTVGSLRTLAFPGHLCPVCMVSNDTRARSAVHPLVCTLGDYHKWFTLLHTLHIQGHATQIIIPINCTLTAAVATAILANKNNNINNSNGR
jgi:hypothetical protein